MVIIKCDNAGLWCNINRAGERENGNIIVCVEKIIFPALENLEFLLLSDL